MGRTTPSWRIIGHEFAKLNEFKQFLRTEDHRRIIELERRMKEELK